MKNKIIAVAFLTILFGSFIAFIYIPDVRISYFERRNLKQFPTKFDYNFNEELDDYFEDQFPFRNSLIQLNSLINRYIINSLYLN